MALESWLLSDLIDKDEYRRILGARPQMVNMDGPMPFNVNNSSSSSGREVKDLSDINHLSGYRALFPPTNVVATVARLYIGISTNI